MPLATTFQALLRPKQPRDREQVKKDAKGAMVTIMGTPPGPTVTEKQMEAFATLKKAMSENSFTSDEWEALREEARAEADVLHGSGGKPASP